jgi:hypothetical protein
MILFSLRCTQAHEFEAWFRDGDSFAAQKEAGEIACPVCGEATVEKAIMAPRLSRSREGIVPDAVKMRAMLVELRQKIEANCDYVGDRFAEEARRIHYGESERHGIYGEASDAESRALTAEGIEFGRIPWVPPTDS